MVPPGESYRAAGSFDVRSVLASLILGVTAAVLSAGAIWLWEISPVPTLLILTPLFQGFAVGWVMAMLVTRLKIRNPVLVGGIGFLCGLLSVFLVHYGHHRHILSQIAQSQREHLRGDQSLSEDTRREYLAELDADPDGMANRALIQNTGHGGVLGSLLVRNEIGVTIKRAKVTGWFLWGVWGVEALIVSGIACLAASTAASRTFCEECELWCEEHAQFQVPASQASELAEAIRSNVPNSVAAIREKPNPASEEGDATLLLHSCPRCDLSFAEIRLRVPKGKDLKETTLLESARVSPEMVEVCRRPNPSDANNSSACDAAGSAGTSGN